MTAKSVSFDFGTTPATCNQPLDHKQLKQKLKYPLKSIKKCKIGKFSTKISDLDRIVKLPSANWGEMKLTKQLLKNWST
jgi:hypothetical protein